MVAYVRGTGLSLNDGDIDLGGEILAAELFVGEMPDGDTSGGSVAFTVGGAAKARPVKHAARSRPWSPPRSAFAGFRFPAEVIVVAAPVYPAVLAELVPSAWHHVEQYANNRIEADHGQLRRRLRPMRGLQTSRTAQVVIAGHAFLQNVRCGHYELGVDARPALRVAAAFTELAQAI
jgi:DDE superfamily endonuclease